jgi:hypothetical protein
MLETYSLRVLQAYRSHIAVVEAEDSPIEKVARPALGRSSLCFEHDRGGRLGSEVAGSH